MPAINLTRLRIQSAKLMDDFTNPEVFLRELHNLLDFYADRTIRSGEVVSPVSVLPSFRVPAAVLRHLELELGPQSEKNPDGTLVLADALWADGYFESRRLAAFLLGRIRPSGEDYFNRLTDWVAETRDPNITRALLVTSLARMRTETPERYLKLMERWAQPSRKKMWSSTIQALLPLLKDENFHNLPPIYEIVRPLIESAPATMQNDLSVLICALFEASPVETTYFLRQVITLSSGGQTVQNIRRVLPSLPQPLQDNLRESIRVTLK